MSDLRPDEPSRDERLRAALRHAPDRDARPPEALSAQILRSAQRATRTAGSPTARLWRAIRSGWAALTRPAPAAAFATLALATVIGAMWQDGSPPPEERAAPAPAAARVQDSPAPAPASAPAAKAAAEAGTDAARERRAVAPAAVTGDADNTRSSVARAPLAGSPTADPLAALAQGWSGASDAQRAALDELRRLSAGRWTRVPASAADAPLSRALADATEQPLGRLTITADAVLWRPEGADDGVWRAPLPPGAAADLRERLGLGATR